MKLIYLILIFLLFSSALIAQDDSKDYLVLTKTTFYPRRILMLSNQKIKIKLKESSNFSKVYLNKINPDNLVLRNSSVIGFDRIDRISGRTVVMQSDKNFGKFLVVLGGAVIIAATGMVISDIVYEGVPDTETIFFVAAPAIPLGLGLIFLGINIGWKRKTFDTKKWNLSVQLRR